MDHSKHLKSGALHITKLRDQWNHYHLKLNEKRTGKSTVVHKAGNLSSGEILMSDMISRGAAK